MHLLALLLRRDLKSGALQAVLTSVGIALGVSLLLAVQLADRSILASFHRTVEALAGRATLEIDGGDLGLDERLIHTVLEVNGVERAAPRLEFYAALPDFPGRRVLVLGIDPFSEEAVRPDSELPGEDRADVLRDWVDPRSLYLGGSIARALGLQRGDRIRLAADQQVREFEVRGVLPARGAAAAFGGEVALLDIANAQWLFDRLGRLDRIDVVTEAGVPIEAVRREIAARLPPSLRVERPARRGEQVDAMVRAFTVNLGMLSGVSLLVGLFLIHNTMTIAVVRRRPQIGILRALGMGRGQLRALLLTEAALLGAVGSLLGIGAGIWLARATTRAMAASVSELYAETPGVGTEASAADLFIAGALGIGAAVAGAWGPMRQALRIPPRTVIDRGSYETEARRGAARGAAAGLVLCLAVPLLSRIPARGGIALGGYLAILGLLAGVVSMIPFLLRATVRALAAWTFGMRRAVTARLAWANLAGALGRTSISLGALAVALSLAIGMVTMISSFRHTVEEWIAGTIRGDLYLIPAVRSDGARMRAAVLDRVLAVEGVAAADPYRAVDIPFGDSLLRLASRDFGILERYARLRIAQGAPVGAATGGARTESVWISEPLARARGWRVGDQIALPTPAGSRPARIAGIFYDYSSDGGRILIDRGLYVAWWNDPFLTSIALYLAPGADREAVRARLAPIVERENLAVLTGREVHREVMAIFDRTFAITYALEAIALAVAFLGIVNTLFASVVERRRELGVLRALGCSRARIGRIVMTEAVSIGLGGLAIGAAVGAGLAWILLRVVNAQSFGWSIPFRWDGRIILQSLALVLGAAIAASLPPARAAMRGEVAEAVRYE